MDCLLKQAEIAPAQCAKVRDGFRRSGVPVAAWAKANGLNPGLVQRVLAGKAKCRRGESHRIAVLLGLKAGDAVDPARYDPRDALR